MLSKKSITDWKLIKWTLVLAAAFVFSTIFSTGLVLADDSAHSGATNSGNSATHEPMAGGPCKADAEKFCKDVKPGGGRIIRCLKDHKDQLSAECKAKGEEMKEHFHEKMEAIKAACKGDVESLCKDVKPGHGNIARCLQENKDRVSEGCKSTIQSNKKK
jgi:hypothetical protein